MSFDNSSYDMMGVAHQQWNESDPPPAPLLPAQPIRFSWNVWPATRVDAARNIVPVACMYTPLIKQGAENLVAYEPLTCRTRECTGVLNPCCPIDLRHKFWTCPFCGGKNAFPPQYANDMTESNLPAELTFGCSTIEYVLNQSAPAIPPVFLFVIDTVVPDEELDQVKDSILRNLSNLPENGLVGLISYGAVCYVHELGFTDLPRMYAFRGTKTITAQQLSLQLGIAVRNDPRGNSAALGAKRFLMPVSECEYTLTTVLEDMRKDRWAVPQGKRAERCTGVAISIAQALLETTHNQHSGRILLIVGGACTIGPGMVVGNDLEESIRCHVDLQKNENNARYTKEATKFYSSIAQKAVAAGHAIDIFACSLDQVGFYEMRPLCEKTGGIVVMADSFSVSIFKDSFKKYFEVDADGSLQMGFNAKIECVLSSDLKVCGAIGACSSLERKTPSVSETEIGESGTSLWAACALDHRSTLAFYFEPISMQAQVGRQGYVQFQTQYTHASGSRRLRVTTFASRYADTSDNLASLALGFDQDVSAVLMSRFAVIKCETEEPVDVFRYVDRMLIRLISRFADYRKDEPASFSLAAEFTLYPQFMYNLRRSPFLNNFNCSPDESAYYRSLLLRENTLNSMLMVQPSLTCYNLDNENSFAVMLDASNLRPNCILLMDTFLNVVIWKGETIQSWFEQNLHERPEYCNLKALIEAPERDALILIKNRFPAPKFVSTEQGGSQARYVLNRVNPSVTHNTSSSVNGFAAPPATDASVIITDDVSLRVFMEHLIKLVVQS